MESRTQGLTLNYPNQTNKMARQSRIQIAGVTQLITQRGNNNQAVFFSEQDYLYYLDILNQTAIKEQCQIHAYVLMSNYIHILATPTKDDGISRLMKGIGQRYVSYINKVEKRSGSLWNGRYKASLIEEGDYLLACMHYIETTPVREGMVKTSKNYKWTSYMNNAQGEDTEVRITQHKSYSSLRTLMGGNDKQIRENYKQLLRESLTQQQLQEINKAINSNSIYASSHFKEVLKKGSDPKS